MLPRLLNSNTPKTGALGTPVLHPIKPKTGLDGDPALRACLRQQGSGCYTIFSARLKEAAEKQLFCALRYLHPVKPKSGLTGPRRYAHAFGRAVVFVFSGLAERLKPCPDTKQEEESFPQPVNRWPETGVK